jgi:carbon monoxide dehydrogenase subunit G
MQMRRKIEFQAPSQVVFSYIGEPAERKLWMTTLESDRVVEGTPQGAGQVTMMTMREGSKSSECRVETTAYEPPYHLAITMSGGSLRAMVMMVDYRFTDLDAGSCLLDYTANMEIPGCLFKILSPIFTLVGGRQLDRMFKKLKSACGSGIRAGLTLGRISDTTQRRIEPIIACVSISLRPAIGD